VPLACERIRNPDIAASLRTIAETKGESFYRGPLAERIAQAAQAHGAALSEADLAAHEADWCGTISGRFDDVALHEIPPNGQGIAALIALGLLGHTPIRDMAPDEPAALHLQIEAMKIGLRDAEAHVADLARMRAVTVEDLLAPDYLAARAAEIDPNRAIAAVASPPRRGGTVYLAAADAEGMMVSFIQSNYHGFGSGACVPGTGIHMQNRGFGFTLAEGHPNLVGPSKRPFHTIIPGFLMRGGAPLMSFGVMGGPMQAQGHLQMTLRTQLWGQDVQTAADAPRWRVVEGMKVACETVLPDSTVATLRGYGHEISLEAPDAAFGFGGAQLVHRLESGAYAAGSDPRKDGQASGF
jgi:gamma-glutamyltranspeptidase/glutathione hydrolase